MKKKIIIITVSIILLISVIAACVILIKNGQDESDTQSRQSKYPQDVTMIELIATPEKYHDKYIRVIAVGNIEFEGDSIYLSKDDYKYHTDNCIWISLDENIISYEDAALNNGKYVIVEGIFNMNNPGHMGMFCGAIENVSRYDRWHTDRYDEIPYAYELILNSIVSAYSPNSNSLQNSINGFELRDIYKKHQNLSEIGYALFDINFDREKELFISAVDSPYIYDVYTLKDGYAVHLFSSEEKAFYTTCGTLFEFSWSNGSAANGYDFYHLEYGKLALKERIVLDAYAALELGLINDLSEANESNSFFKSKTDKIEDYESISGDEAHRIIEEYHARGTLDIEYIPLSEYQN